MDEKCCQQRRPRSTEAMSGDPRSDRWVLTPPLPQRPAHPEHETGFDEADVALVGGKRTEVANPIFRRFRSTEGEHGGAIEHPYAVRIPYPVPRCSGIISIRRRLDEFEVHHGFGSGGSTGSGSSVQFA